MIYCGTCKSEVDARIEKRLETILVRGEEIEVNSRVAVCPQCREDLIDEELEATNLGAAYDAYRVRHHLLSPRDISETRQKYGLSQRALAKLLGWGEITIHRYESGAIQDSAHETVLRLIREPANMKQVLEENRTALSSEIATRLEEKLDAMLADREVGEFETLLEKLCSTGSPSEDNGFREFDVEKLEESVLYFVSRVEHAFKTKLNKLLWYADFLSYRTSSRSITGSAYVAATHGPVPRNYDLLLGEMVRKGLIRATEVEFPNGTCGELLEPSRDPNMSLFNGVEQACMGKVVREFRYFTASDIRKRSHSEKAYEATYEEEGQWNGIPYSLAGTLSLTM